jgi:hypothetical protein
MAFNVMLASFQVLYEMCEKKKHCGIFDHSKNFGDATAGLY